MYDLLMMSDKDETEEERQAKHIETLMFIQHATKTNNNASASTHKKTK